MFEKIGKLIVIVLQNLSIDLVELPIIGVHLVIFCRVFLPNLCRFNRVETRRMRFVESLHLGNLQDAFVVILDIIVPNAGTSHFHSLSNRMGIDDIVANLGH